MFANCPQMWSLGSRQVVANVNNVAPSTPNKHQDKGGRAQCSEGPILVPGGRGTLPWGPDQAYVHSICNGEGATSWLGALCVKNSENGVTETGKGVVLECSETPHAADVHKID